MAEFWTTRRLELAHRSFNTLNRYLEGSGIHEQPFSTQFLDLYSFGETFSLAETDPISGRMRIPITKDLDDALFVRLLLHEGGHFFSARIKKHGT